MMVPFKTRYYLLVVIATIAAISMSFGCRHSNFGPLDPITVTSEDWWRSGPREIIPLEVSVGDVTVHTIDLLFNQTMTTQPLEMSITNDAGQEITRFEQRWLNDRITLRLTGPFAFCKDYHITVKAGVKNEVSQVFDADLSVVAHMGENPLDFDRNETCTADVVVSPLFGLDGALLRGDLVSTVPDRLLRRQGLDNEDTFYIDYTGTFDESGPMVLMPMMLETGAPALAKLSYEKEDGSNRLYELDLWNVYEPVSERPSSSIIYGEQGGFWELDGPMYGGDMDGDGVSELLLSAESVLTAGVLQKVYLLEGPVAEGSGLLLTDLAGGGRIMGNSADTLMPFVSVGDINGDGFGELGAMMMTDELIFGLTNKWEIWILPGQSEADRAFVDPMWKVTGHATRIMVDMDAGDLDGDGNSDLIVTEVEYLYAKIDGVYRHVRPHIGIFLGGKSLDGRSMDTADSMLNFWMQQETIVSVQVLGDINGDGRDDIGIMLTQEDANGWIISSKVFLFVGRKLFGDNYNPASTVYASNNGEIDVAGAGVNDLSGAAIGDINNDGYDDFMITADEGTGRTIYIFFGGETYTGNKMTLDEADVVWTFMP